MIKTSSHGYVKTKITKDGMLLPQEIAVVPTGKIEGDRAEFISITPGNPQRLWLQRKDIY